MTTSPTFVALLSAAAWFFIFIVAHITGWRAGFENARWLMITYITCLLGSLLTVIGISAAAGSTGLDLLALAVTFLTGACLFVMYVPAVYTVLTSLSVQTMILLHRSSGGLSEPALYDRFAGRPMLENRLATLVSSGYLVAEGTRFRLTSRGRALAKIFAFVKAFWRLGPGG